MINNVSEEEVGGILLLKYKGTAGSCYADGEWLER
jgi:hypothetical protein